MGLRADVKTMRDVPQEPQSSSIAQYIDSLPEERSFMDKLKGNSSLDIGDPKDHPLIGNFMDAIRTGQLDEPRVQKLMKRNPMAASAFASAFDEYKKASTQQSSEKSILSQNFGAGDYLPPDQAGPVRPERANFGSATSQLIGMGSVDTAGKIAGIEKQMREGKQNINRAPSSYELAARANGQTSGHPLVDTMTPEQAAKTLQTGAPLTMATGFDENGNPYPIAYPRGTVPGGPQKQPGVPLSPPKVKEIPDKINETTNKLSTDIQSIDLILSAINPDATPADKAALKQQGVNWDPNAVGAKGLQPEFMLQRTDPQGVGVRAAIADFSADKIHERYAGNLTGGEIDRSKQWAAQKTDSTEALRTKLINQKRVMENLLKERAQSYSQKKGYMAHPVLDKYNQSKNKSLSDIFK